MTVLVPLLVAVVTVAFPKEGEVVPPVTRCYAIGATDGGETNIVIQGRPVSVHRSGAWATVLDVKPGTNVLEVGGARRTFVVQPASPVAGSAPRRTYGKVPCAADLPKPHPSGRRPDEITVVLDPGHGGTDPGALSPHRLPEKDANLRLAKAVSSDLRRRGYRVVMTREDDSFPALYDRPKIACETNADVFVSIHHNAPGYQADPLATRYQAVYAWNDIGRKLALAIGRRLAAARPSLQDKGVLHANFAVTRNPEIPSCLVESDFVTSPDGELDIWDPALRRSAAKAIADGIDDWVASGGKAAE